MEFAIKVSGHGQDHEVGKGLGFWLTEKRMPQGDVYGSGDKWKGIGVIFDTNDDDDQKDNPIIMAVANDGTKSYDHATDGKDDRFGGCRAKYRNRDSSFVRVKLKFQGSEDVPGTGHLQMWLSMKDQGHFDVCFAKDMVSLNCGYNNTSCRLGFSAQNMGERAASGPDGQVSGDAMSVSGLRVWDLGEIANKELRRSIAARDRLFKRNELHPEIQEMIGSVEYRARSQGDELMEGILEEIARDKLSKHKEFGELHNLINATLVDKGPVTKRDVLQLIANVKQLTKLAERARELMAELRGDAHELLQAGQDMKQAHDESHRRMTDMVDTKIQTERRHAKSAKVLRQATADAASYGWTTYLLCVQGVAVVALLFYQRSQASVSAKSHLV
eukprot:TRINITY_DN5846_c0_g1_i1.p1 TRINITY_DN5846_c0_g1~~TRINITY_DN5846_c0_g1_i1.p1  ORF type:complete len:387 (+),score=106.23 TRINITY_DN5846_c0_g1_i1:256-1416(+)